MRHTLIACFCTVFIIIFTVFSYFYIYNFTTDIKNIADSQNTSQAIDFLADKKEILELMINKSYIDSLEETVYLWDNAVKFDNKQDIELYKKNFSLIISDIQKEISRII